MAFLKLIAIIELTFIVARALFFEDDLPRDSQTAINYCLPNDVVPTHYNIKLIPHLVVDNFTFSGETNINILVRRETRNLHLHALRLLIDKEATELVNNDGVVYKPKAHKYERITEILTLEFDDELSLGHYTLNFNFNGVLSNEGIGFFRQSYQNEANVTVWLALTYFEATWARLAFPCWDEPALKATFNISIKHHRNYTALSNMPALPHSDENDEDDAIWTHFDTTPVMSTYLVAFVVSDYLRISNADGTVNVWSRSQLAPHSKFAHQVAQRSGELLTQYANSTDKVPKMDHVLAPQYRVSAMENWGLVIYKEVDCAYNEAEDTVKHKHRAAVIVAHEMAHQWFGNVVSPLWWSHVWLNEGFASFFESYILDKIFEDWRMMDLFVIEKQHSAFRYDISNQIMPVAAEVNSPEEIAELFSISSYNKAPVILRMVQHTITDKVFRKGVIRYLNTHQFSSATSDDLWNALQAALDESNVPHDDYKLKYVMDTWITKRHYPIVRVTRNYETGEVILEQEHFVPNAEISGKAIDEDKWWIPITFTTQSNPNFTNTVPTHWLKPQDQNITISGIDSNDWIIVNLQEMGYYFVNYDEVNWKKIASYLNSDEYAKIHVLNRAQLIDNAFNLVMAGQLNFSTFLDIASYLEKETDYIPWYAMFYIFNFITDIFKIPEGEDLKEPLYKMLNGLVEKVGYEEIPTESDLTKLTRIDALYWASYFGHPECRRMATAKLEKYLMDPETHKIPPNLKEWILCNGMFNASFPTWNQMLAMYTKNSNQRELLYYLSCTENPEIIMHYLDIHDSIINSTTYYWVYNKILFQHVNKDLIFDHVLATLNQTASRGIPIYDLFGSIIYSVNSTPKLNKISEFLKKNYEGNETLIFNVEKIIKDQLTYLPKRYKFTQTTTED